ncbi:hypothetical protein EZ456_04200 [Pedobacter psychrodurus]|uniref:Uncharacterized protein n=1 Tax=Pedobacter psychrodurus TaxID=2530456 RepID=A0A4V2MR89_9SPHI|nr:hypothetical protein [Pedobacter psychrodurus]TCD28597.1 hypothetical protein EZ456_04200 [Pedobacter psychrodurus]
MDVPDIWLLSEKIILSGITHDAYVLREQVHKEGIPLTVSESSPAKMATKETVMKLSSGWKRDYKRA